MLNRIRNQERGRTTPPGSPFSLSLAVEAPVFLLLTPYSWGHKSFLYLTYMLPDLDTEDFDIMKLSKEELLLVPHEIVQWRCKIKLCKCYTRVMDFGIYPLFYWKDTWIDNVNGFYLCSKHWKRYKNLVVSNQEDIPFKRLESGLVPHGWDLTKKVRTIT